MKVTVSHFNEKKLLLPWKFRRWLALKIIITGFGG